MKGAQEFILQKLKELQKSIEGLKIKYEYKEHSSLHLIEILPLNLFESNEEYISKEILIENEFESKFGSTQEILFVSENSLNEVKNAQYSFGYNILDVIFLNQKWVQSTSDERTSFKLIDDIKESIIVENTSYALAA
jgi:hypothetical protein